jgi:hypothetical protein
MRFFSRSENLTRKEISTLVFLLVFDFVNYLLENELAFVGLDVEGIRTEIFHIAFGWRSGRLKL